MSSLKYNRRNIYGDPIEPLVPIRIISEKTIQKIREFFCRHRYKIEHILGMSEFAHKNTQKLPTMVYDKSFTRCYCSKCGKIFVEEEDSFKF
jgi:hypothetical protein